jgi:hypothetical protein
MGSEGLTSDSIDGRERSERGSQAINLAAARPRVPIGRSIEKYAGAP